ncbi:putative membrane protein [Plasmodium reichenowi]|uniref:Putative membrane protein n=1 Tax=Plasmodium reichenowi TaxID=5854 RepID=A0A151L5U2_PLARE|nr:putative membrane protein [Plasmodium reichenowi]KYN94321.1 putative membrane protein [Plasmodium reichenowi]
MIKLVLLFYIFLIFISSFKCEVYKKFSIILKGKATLNSSIISTVGIFLSVVVSVLESIGNTIIKKSHLIYAQYEKLLEGSNMLSTNEENDNCEFVFNKNLNGKGDIINFEANNTYSSDTSYCSNYVGCYNYDDDIICRHYYVDGNKINEEQRKAINKFRIYKRSKKGKKYSFFNISIKSFQNCKNKFRKKKEKKYKERKNKNKIYSSKSLYNDNINTRLDEYEHDNKNKHEEYLFKRQQMNTNQVIERKFSKNKKRTLKDNDIIDSIYYNYSKEYNLSNNNINEQVVNIIETFTSKEDVDNMDNIFQNYNIHNKKNDIINNKAKRIHNIYYSDKNINEEKKKKKKNSYNSNYNTREINKNIKRKGRFLQSIKNFDYISFKKLKIFNFFYRRGKRKNKTHNCLSNTYINKWKKYNLKKKITKKNQNKNKIIYPFYNYYKDNFYRHNTSMNNYQYLSYDHIDHEETHISEEISIYSIELMPIKSVHNMNNSLFIKRNEKQKNIKYSLKYNNKKKKKKTRNKCNKIYILNKKKRKINKEKFNQRIIAKHICSDKKKCYSSLPSHSIVNTTESELLHYKNDKRNCSKTYVRIQKNIYSEKKKNEHSNNSNNNNNMKNNNNNNNNSNFDQNDIQNVKKKSYYYFYFGIILTSAVAPAFNIFSNLLLPASMVGFVSIRIICSFLLERFVLKEKQSLYLLVGIPFSTVGLILITIFSSNANDPKDIDYVFNLFLKLGSILLLTSEIVFSHVTVFFSVLYLQKKRKNNFLFFFSPLSSGIMGSLVTIFSKASLMGLMSIILNTQYKFYHIFINYKLLILTMITLFTTITEIFYTPYLLKHYNLTHIVSLKSFGNISFNAINGMFIFNERPSCNYLWSCGFFLVLIGILFLSYENIIPYTLNYIKLYYRRPI